VTVDIRAKAVKNDHTMLRVAIVARWLALPLSLALFGLVLGACTADPLANICSNATVCGSGVAGFRLCTRAAGSDAFYLACADRMSCDDEADGMVFQCLSPSDCVVARDQAVAWCGMQP
jgi:hypothetical protein